MKLCSKLWQTWTGNYELFLYYNQRDLEEFPPFYYTKLLATMEWWLWDQKRSILTNLVVNSFNFKNGEDAPALLKVITDRSHLRNDSRHGFLIGVDLGNE